MPKIYFKLRRRCYEICVPESTKMNIFLRESAHVPDRKVLDNYLTARVGFDKRVPALVRVSWIHGCAPRGNRVICSIMNR